MRTVSEIPSAFLSYSYVSDGLYHLMVSDYFYGMSDISVEKRQET